MNEKTKEPSPPTPQAGGGVDAGVVAETDEFHGVGGSYILDPLTGKRTRNPSISDEKIDTSKKG